MWYAFHAFHYFKYKDGPQDDYFGWENIYLIEADTVEEARSKGEIRAKEDEGDSDGTLTSNGRPAILTYAGILKIVECEDLDIRTGNPVSGTELSYSPLTLADRREFENFVTGRSATVTYHGVDENDEMGG